MYLFGIGAGMEHHIVPNYLNQPIKIITTPFLTGKTSTTTNTNEDSTANNDNLEDLIDNGESSLFLSQRQNKNLS
jgi:hypothetical protein